MEWTTIQDNLADGSEASDKTDSIIKFLGKDGSVVANKAILLLAAQGDVSKQLANSENNELDCQDVAVVDLQCLVNIIDPSKTTPTNKLLNSKNIMAVRDLAAKLEVIRVVNECDEFLLLNYEKINQPSYLLKCMDSLVVGNFKYEAVYAKLLSRFEAIAKKEKELYHPKGLAHDAVLDENFVELHKRVIRDVVAVFIPKNK